MTKKVKIFVKTKNDPNGLKCKIMESGFPKRGEGVRHLGKIPKKSCFFGSFPKGACPKKMLESRPEDALVKLVKLVNLVKLVKPWRLY